MDLLSLILISLGLTVDSFAVSVVSGVMLHRVRIYAILKIAIVLAVFQTIMPLLGWLLASGLKQYIENYDHWIAFGLLLGIGIKMFAEGAKKDEEQKCFNPLKMKILIGLAIATSIDALAVGAGFAFLDVKILQSIFIIGLATLLVSSIGLLTGIKFGKKFKFKLEYFGGIILIGIGVKILIEHLFLH